MDKEILIYENYTIKECLKQLDKTATGILFVVNDDDKLMGTLSDGDIRRAILHEKELDQTILGIYNNSPIFVYDNFSKENIKSLFLENRIDIIPVVDKQKKVLNYIDWESLFGNGTSRDLPILDIPVVVMAGGKGTRMAPFTNVLPKPLIPVGDRTIMEIIIDEFRKYEINDFYFTLNYRGQMIEAYFNSIEKDYNIFNLWEDEFEGTAGSLKLLPIENIKDNFILSNCDVLVKADYSDALKHHINSGASVTVLSSIQHFKIPYGVIDFKNNGEVTAIKEKPEYSFPINTGVYIVNKNALSHIPVGEIFHMTHLMEKLISCNEKVLMYPVNENDYIDIGQWEEYRKSLERLI